MGSEHTNTTQPTRKYGRKLTKVAIWISAIHSELMFGLRDGRRLAQEMSCTIVTSKLGLLDRLGNVRDSVRKDQLDRKDDVFEADEQP